MLVHHFLQQKYPLRPVPTTEQQLATWGEPAGSRGHGLALRHQVQQVEGRHRCAISSGGKGSGRSWVGERKQKQQIKTSETVGTLMEQLMAWVYLGLSTRMVLINHGAAVSDGQPTLALPPSIPALRWGGWFYPRYICGVQSCSKIQGHRANAVWKCSFNSRAKMCPSIETCPLRQGKKPKTKDYETSLHKPLNLKKA